MNIVFLTSELSFGGAERTIQYLANSFVQMGENVSIVVCHKQIDYKIDDRIDVDVLGLEKIYGNRIKKFLIKIKNFLLLKFQLHKKVLEKRPDAVVCILADAAKYILSSHKKHSYKLIVSERSNPAYENCELVLNRKKIMKQSDGVIFQTKAAQQFYEEEIIKKSTIIQNAVGNEFVYQINSWDSRNTDKSIVAIGRLVEAKDYKVLINAFEIVLKKHGDYTLEIYGEGNQRTILESVIHEKGLENYIRLMGEAKDALVKARNSKCYVLSSKYEGMPNALMEAMAIGMPCVSTDCPNGPNELIRNGVNGLLVPVGDVKQLADSICKVIENDAFAERMGNEAKKIKDTNNVSAISHLYREYIKSVSEMH